MSKTLLSLACHSYGLAALGYLAYLVRQWKPLPVVGRVLIGLGLGAHATALAMQLGDQGGTPVGLAQGLSTVAFLLLVIFFAIDLTYRKPAIGAFLTPLALGLLVP